MEQIWYQFQQLKTIVLIDCEYDMEQTQFAKRERDYSRALLYGSTTMDDGPQLLIWRLKGWLVPTLRLMKKSLTPESYHKRRL